MTKRVACALHVMAVDQARGKIEGVIGTEPLWVTTIGDISEQIKRESEPQRETEIFKVKNWERDGVGINSVSQEIKKQNKTSPGKGNWGTYGEKYV